MPFARIGEHPLSILIVVLIVVILFGWKRLPDAARSVGRSMRIFKSEMSEMKSDSKGASSETVQGETLNEQQTAAAEARRKAADARAAAERAEAEAAEAERAANGSTRL